MKSEFSQHRAKYFREVHGVGIKKHKFYKTVWPSNYTFTLVPVNKEHFVEKSFLLWLLPLYHLGRNIFKNEMSVCTCEESIVTKECI